MKVEDKFDLEIPDTAAAKLVTVGQLHTYVVDALRQRLGSGVDSEQVYSELCAIICKQLGVRPEAVVPSASFINDLRMD